LGADRSKTIKLFGKIGYAVVALTKGAVKELTIASGGSPMVETVGVKAFRGSPSKDERF